MILLILVAFFTMNKSQINCHRIDIVVFVFAIKKDSPVQTARKLYFLVFQPRSISGSNGYTRYEESRENTSRLRIPQRFVRFILKMSFLRGVLVLGA